MSLIPEVPSDPSQGRLAPPGPAEGRDAAPYVRRPDATDASLCTDGAVPPAPVSESRREDQTALLASESRHHSTLWALTEGVVLQGRDGRVIDANPSAAHILGLPYEALIGLSCADPCWRPIREDGSPWPGSEHPAMQTLRTGLPQRGAIMGIESPGRGRRWISINASPIHEAGSLHVSAAVVTFVDITEQRELEARLATSITELNDLYENAPCGYHSLDADGRYLRINATELEWLGCTRDQVVGRLGIIDFISEESRQTFREAFPRIKAGESVPGIEVDLIGRQGQRRRVSVNASAIRDSQGQFIGTRSVLHDITDLKQAEEARVRRIALEAENTQLRETERLQRLFLSNLSHELRTPLNGVIGLSQVLSSGSVSPDSGRFGELLTRITQSGQHLLQLIDTLLTFAKANAGKIEFNPSRLSVPDAIQDAIALLEVEIDRQQVAIDVEVMLDPIDIEFDPMRLRQVLVSLLGNAVKFSHRQGRIMVRAANLGPMHVTISVQDFGMGIAADQLPRVFAQFRQLSEGNSKSHEGLGLGLALARQLVQSQGGTIDAQSTPGVGSIFIITLPRRSLIKASALKSR